jgi:mycothiol synthase
MSVELRAPRLDELAALTELINRDADELYGEREMDEDTMRMWLTGPRLNPETDIRVAVAEGALRGYVDVADDPHPVYAVDLRVPPSESDDVRATLMDWAERRVKEREGEVVRFDAASVDEPMTRLLQSGGHRLIRHFYRMRIEFDGDLPEPQWPEGITVRPGVVGDAATAYEAHQESFADHWEFSPMPFEEWKHVFMSDPRFDPSLWFVVEAGAETVAIALCREHEGEPGLGWVAVLGVRKPWRRRGLGRALLLHSFHEFRRRGFHAAALGVDAESLTGANRLYESVGMRVIRRFDVYEKPL